MHNQFFGKPFRLIFAILAGVFLLSILVFKTAFVWPVLIAIIIGTFLLTVKRLEWGLVAAFAELFANSHGHLVDAPIFGLAFSMREAVFVGVMLGWVVWMVKRGTWNVERGTSEGNQNPWHDPRLAIFFPLAAAVALGFAVGFVQHRPSIAFQDGNAYLYLLYVLPILSVRWTDVTRRLLLQTLAAGATWVSVLTLGLLYVFTHVPKWMLSSVYAFIRDTRTGELTEMLGVFRIFLQAQMSVLVLILLVTIWSWFYSRQVVGSGQLAASSKQQAVGRLSPATSYLLPATLSLLWATIIISLSRSFWLGLAATAFVAIALLVREKKLDAKSAWKAIGLQVASLVGGLIILVAVILFPLPPRTTSVGSFSDLLSARTTDTSDVAISSRWNLLPEMVKSIFVSPIVGSGFGQTVTFKTDDPRARAIHPDGTWTTYSFEWGWLDAWLKMGILGPLAFLALLAGLFNGLRPLFSTDRAWLGIGLFSTVILVYATHALSPYLNHPLGLGLILFCLPFFPDRKPAEAQAVVPSPVPSVVPQAAVLAREGE